MPSSHRLEVRVPVIPPDQRTPSEFRRWQRRMTKRCRQLRVGDLIRFVQMPSNADWPDICFPRETKQLYKRLIARKRPSRIVEIDEWGYPWISYKFRDRRGRWEQHWLMINDDGWVRVRRRGPLTEPAGRSSLRSGRRGDGA